MKAVFLIILILVILGIGVVIFVNPFKHTTKQVAQTPTQAPVDNLAPTDDPNRDCKPKQLDAVVSTPEGAAGSLYATLTITNISKTPCKITLGNNFTAKSPTNVTLHNQTTASSEVTSLAPSEKVYSQVRIPNGPQCPSGTTEQAIVFYYQQAVQFMTKDGELLKMQACKSESEKTVVDVWPLSKTPATH